MGREVGGGIGMGKTCEPKAFSFQCMTEFTTNKKKKEKEKKEKEKESGMIVIQLLAYDLFLKAENQVTHVRSRFESLRHVALI